jgi:hypothetical protein
MTPSERRRAIAYLNETRDRLLGATRGLSPAQLQFQPAPGRWSVAECLEHIVFVEDRILGRISAALAEPPNTAKRSAFAGSDDELLGRVTDRGDRRQAPEIVRPTGRWPHDRLIPEFEAVRKRSAEFAASARVNLRHYFLPHPFFGDLDCYQYLLLIGGHSDRHCAQAEEVMSTRGFPR